MKRDTAKAAKGKVKGAGTGERTAQRTVQGSPPGRGTGHPRVLSLKDVADIIKMTPFISIVSIEASAERAVETGHKGIDTGKGIINLRSVCCVHADVEAIDTVCSHAFQQLPFLLSFSLLRSFELF